MKKKLTLDDCLWNSDVSLESFGNESEYRSMVFDQYKSYVELADRISARRGIVNAFFLTLNGLVVSAGAAILDKGIEFESKWLLLLPFLVLFIQLFFWWRLIISYKQLNKAKFTIIGEIESQLPIRMYGSAEWDFLLKKGEDRKVYWPLTHLEQSIPWLFAIGYFIALVSLLFS